MAITASMAEGGDDRREARRFDRAQRDRFLSKTGVGEAA